MDFEHMLVIRNIIAISREAADFILGAGLLHHNQKDDALMRRDRLITRHQHYVPVAVPVHF